MKVWLIQEEQVSPEDGPLYWTNRNGWIDAQDEADTFSDEAQKHTQLPIGGIWVKENRQWSVVKKDAIESMLIDMWASIGMGIPENYEDLVQDCYEDVCSCADPENWHSGDVAIAFRRWIEDQTK